MSDLVSWVYVSACLLDGNEQDEAISDIVAVSQSRNAKLSITGAFGLGGAHLFQVIEGPTASLRAVQASIRRDPRHTSIETLFDGPCATRLFPTWSLAYAGPFRHTAPLIQASVVQARGQPDRRALDIVRFLQGVVGV